MNHDTMLYCQLYSAYTKKKTQFVSSYGVSVQSSPPNNLPMPVRSNHDLVKKIESGKC